MRSQAKTTRVASPPVVPEDASVAVAAVLAARQAPAPATNGTAGDELVVVVDYRAVGSTELSLDEGERVHVLERNNTGWWYVDSKGKRGWVPSSSFDTAKMSDSPVIGRKEATKKQQYITMADFNSAADDGISFKGGEDVEVIEKAATGWWYVVIAGQEGWAPSSYIEEKDPVSAVTSPSSDRSGPSSPINKVGGASSDHVGGGGLDLSKVALKPVKKSSSDGKPAAEKQASTGAKMPPLKPAHKNSKPDEPVATSPPKANAKPTPQPSSKDESGDDVASSGSIAAQIAKLRAVNAVPPEGSASGGGSSSQSGARKPIKLPGVAMNSTDGKNPVKPAAVPPAVPEPAKPKPPASPQPTKAKPPVVPEHAKKAKPPAVPEPAKAKPPAVPEPAKTKPPAVPDPAKAKPPAVPEPAKAKPPAVPEPAKAKPAPVPLAKARSNDKLGKLPSAASKDQYVAVANYEKEDESGITLKEGQMVVVEEKNDNGWWYVKCGGKEGWAPSTFLEQAKGDGEKKPAAAPPGNKKPRGVVSPPAGGKKIAVMPVLPKEAAKFSEKKAAVLPVAAKEPAKLPGKKAAVLPGAGKARAKSPEKETYVASADYKGEGGDEISFREGNTVTVLDKADTGWWFVKVGTKEGWAPSTFLQKKTAAAVPSSSGPARPTPPKSKKYVVVADYDGEDGEISLKEGQTIQVLEKADTGWWFVKAGRKEGWAPSTFISEA